MPPLQSLPRLRVMPAHEWSMCNKPVRDADGVLNFLCACLPPKHSTESCFGLIAPPPAVSTMFSVSTVLHLLPL
jgi:hypothetical protein